MQVAVLAAWILPSYVCNAVAVHQIRQLILRISCFQPFPMNTLSGLCP